MTKKAIKQDDVTHDVNWAKRTSDGTYTDEQPAPEPDDTTITLEDGQAYQHVAFALPRRVLYALLNATHPEADTDRAVLLGLGLIFKPADEPPYFVLSEMGQLVIDGTDQVALRHKMLASWRASHNKQIDAEVSNIE